MSDASVQLRNMLLAGAMAGLVGGAIVGGAVFATSGGSAGGPIEVYGTVGIDNGYSGSTMISPVMVQTYALPGTSSNQPDGSLQSPYYVVSNSAVWTKPCSEAGSFNRPQGC